MVPTAWIYSIQFRFWPSQLHQHLHPHSPYHLSQYLSDDCQLVVATSRRQLRSSGNFKCTLTSTNTRLGDRAFAAAGPRLWNDLPRFPISSPLAWFIVGHVPPKTENVFVCSRHQHLVTVVFRRCVQINLLTYLLTYLGSRTYPLIPYLYWHQYLHLYDIYWL